jgi:hypothetical protein
MKLHIDWTGPLTRPWAKPELPLVPTLRQLRERNEWFSAMLRAKLQRLGSELDR